MSLRGRRCLVIGATGFVGRALTARLLREGASVHALTRGGKTIPKVRCHAGDLDDAASVRRCLEATEPEIVFFLARADEPPSAKRVRREISWTRAAAGRGRLIRAAFSAPTPALYRKDRALHEKLGATTLELFGVYGPGRPVESYPGGGFRDWVHVEDVAEAFIRAAGPQTARRRIPVGTGREWDGRAYRRVPERPAACRKALGWAPKARPLLESKR